MGKIPSESRFGPCSPRYGHFMLWGHCRVNGHSRPPRGRPKAPKRPPKGPHRPLLAISGLPPLAWPGAGACEGGLTRLPGFEEACVGEQTRNLARGLARSQIVVCRDACREMLLAWSCTLFAFPIYWERGVVNLHRIGPKFLHKLGRGDQWDGQAQLACRPLPASREGDRPIVCCRPCPHPELPNAVMILCLRLQGPFSDTGSFFDNPKWKKERILVCGNFRGPAT